MRKYLFNIIEPQSKSSRASTIYDIVMIAVILLSFIPLVFKDSNQAFRNIDIICVIVFIVDYLLRWITADYRFDNKGVIPFIRYPFSIMAIIDLLSILPSIIALNGAFRAFRVIRLLKALRVLRVFRIFRYSKNMQMLKNAFVSQSHSLFIVLMLAVGYIFVSALVIFQVEPESFDNYKCQDKNAHFLSNKYVQSRKRISFFDVSVYDQDGNELASGSYTYTHLKTQIEL